MVTKYTAQQGTNIVKLVIKRESETNEWLVKYYLNGKYNEDRTAYCDNQVDAIAIAKIIVNRIELGIEKV